MYMVLPPILYVLLNERSFAKDMLALNCVATTILSNMFWKDYDKSSIWFKLDVTFALLIAFQLRENYLKYIILYGLSDINLQHGRFTASLVFYLLFRHLVYLDVTCILNDVNPLSPMKSAIVYNMNWITLYICDTTYKKGLMVTTLFIALGIPLVLV